MDHGHKNLIIALVATAVLAAVVLAGLKFLTPAEINRPIEARTEMVSTEQWVRGLKTIIAVGVCAEPSYFAACYEFKDSSCAETLQTMAFDCYEQRKMEMPSALRLPADGVFWGRQLSICAVRTAEEKLANAKRSKNPSCTNMTVWSEKNPAPTMTKARFMFGAEFEMPVRFCEPKGPIRACFQMSDEECAGLLGPAVSGCIETLSQEIPGDLKIPQDTLIWSTRIGKCVGEQLESKYAAKKSGDCRALQR